MDIEISNEDSDYMYNIVQKIIDKCGPRMPCSPQEAKSAEIIKKELEETCDEVKIEPFKCHPRAALGWIRIVIFIVLLSFCSFFLIKLFQESFWAYFLSVLSSSFIFIGILIAWEEFFCYEEFIDPIFKEKDSQNVIGKIRTTGEIKNVIIFSGHHDSALQFNLLKYLKHGYVIIVLLGFGILFFWFIASLIFLILTIFTFVLDFAMIYDFFLNIALWLLIIGAIPLVILLFFVTPGKRANKVPGAVDNLSAVAIVLGIGRFLKNHKEVIPKNTEIRLISFGCEEAFLRGAYRYVEAHLEELKNYDAECVNLDTIQSIDYLTFSDKEPTTRTIHSEEVVQKLIKAAELVGVKVKVASLGGGSFLEKIVGLIGGGTDAAAFSKSNIKASSITALNLLKIVHFYHQETDTPDKIEKGVLENTLKICIGYLINESKTN
ncbi:MAG: M28 family peptidase [Candidatus Lokiarchaeota archaeon]|nr:M28 family peptidase [Candidatus Lokiarchaeota archaeon]